MSLLLPLTSATSTERAATLIKPASYLSCSIKRRRRSKAAMATIRKAIIGVVAAQHPMNVRSVFYQLSNLKLISKTEAECSQTVGRLLIELRLDGTIPFSHIADNTRWVRKPTTYDSYSEALEDTAKFYRQSVWTNQKDYVEVWLEKEGLASVLFPVTSLYDVPLMATKGYSSISFLHSAAETITAQRKPAFLYYLGDWDPSGLDITKNVERRLREFAPQAEIHFERIAVTKRQIEEWELPTRPTKASDSRARGFQGNSVEVDAIPPTRLRELVQGAIEQHINADQLAMIKVIEEEGRNTLKAIWRKAA